MTADFTPVFLKYEELRDSADKIFSSQSGKYPQCVSCRPGCADCCHALFDLSLVEAAYLSKAFSEKFEHGPERSAILERASNLDRRLAKLKRELFRAEKNGEPAEKIMNMAASARTRCPLLDDNDHCLLYEARPLTCRLYGVPLAIDGESHVCGFSNFDKGATYPTVRLDKIQKRLEDMSAEIARLSQSPYDLANIYMPLSMALLTDFNESWFGTDGAQAGEKA